MVKQIIKEAMDKNPIGLKKALEEEFRDRIGLALEAKVSNKDPYTTKTPKDIDNLEISSDFDIPNNHAALRDIKGKTPSHKLRLGGDHGMAHIYYHEKNGITTHTIVHFPPSSSDEENTVYKFKGKIDPNHYKKYVLS
jgi:hypothetical protein